MFQKTSSFFYKNTFKEFVLIKNYAYLCQAFRQIVLWCNGSTTGFGSVCPGSNPGKTTKIKANYLLKR